MANNSLWHKSCKFSHISLNYSSNAYKFCQIQLISVKYTQIHSNTFKIQSLSVLECCKTQKAHSNNVKSISDCTFLYLITHVNGENLLNHIEVRRKICRICPEGIFGVWKSRRNLYLHTYCTLCIIPIELVMSEARLYHDWIAL